MYQLVNPQDEMFGEYGEADVAADAQANAIRSVGRFAGLLARAFMTRQAAQRAARGTMPTESPCPDAVPGSVGPTPCEQKAAALRAEAEAWKARRRMRGG
jgi:hypothetical protein